MSGLQFDGVQVRSSILGHKAYKAAPCDFLLPVTPANRAKAIAVGRLTTTFRKTISLRFPTADAIAVTPRNRQQLSGSGAGSVA